MGQSESGENDDENCFRACMKQNKTRGNKIQALPHYGQKRSSDDYKQTPQPFQGIRQKVEPPKSPAKQNCNADSLDTSLQQRLYMEQGVNKKKNQLHHSTNIVTIDPKEPPLVEGAADTSNQIVLGLQSKFSYAKNTCIVSSSKMAFIKTNAFCEGTAPGTQYNSNDKESGSQTRISNKTSQTATSSRSRNILINKIQEIKQKYYQRQLEIEICHDQREYQAQINQLEQIQKTFTENSDLPEQSLGQIRAIRNKILAKLRQKREKNYEQPQAEQNIIKDEATLNNDKSVTIHDHLELYSREDRVSFDETMFESQKAKKQRKVKNRLSTSGRVLNRSLNNSHSLQEGSVDEKMEFSDYSQESLHEIRELDEEYEDYRSKMTGPSAFNKNNLRNIKPSQNNFPSNMYQQQGASRCTKLNTGYGEQQIQQRQLSPPLNTYILPLQGPVENQIRNESSQVKSYMTKEVGKVNVTSKSNKILLF